MKKNSFIQGTIIASIAIIFTKFLGAVYVIPFYRIVGETGGTLYSYAYNIYNLFLNISIAGIPIAISKIISEYNEQDMYKSKEKSYKIAKKIMIILALFTFMIMFVFAEEFATLILKGIKEGNSVKDVTMVLRSISFCLLIIPSLSVTKGYLQGHKFIKPCSISQIIEQIVRIAIVLIGSYLVMNYFSKGNIPLAVSVALLGAFVGGCIALIYLKIKIKKNKKNFLNDKVDEVVISTKEIIKKIIAYSIPLIIVSVATNLYDTANMILVLRGLTIINFEPAADIELISSIIATWGIKICMIINSIGMGMSISIIPHMVASFVKNDFKEINNKFNKAIKTLLVITIPMAIGISFLSIPVYRLFYGESVYGPIILKYLVFMSVLACIHIVMNMALQALNKFKIIYLNIFVGLGINILLNIPLTLLFNKIGIYPYYGSITATIIGYIVSFIIIFVSLKKNFKFDYKEIIKTIGKMFYPTTAMIAGLLVLNIFLSLDVTGYLNIILVLLIYTFVGATIYLIVAYRNNLLYDVFGKEYIGKILKKLKFRRKAK